MEEGREVKKGQRHTAAISGNAVDLPVIAHLEEALLACPAGTCPVFHASV